ncbi:cytochrome P450 [Fomes fomentarius]|nr:cytochrome P450 [Fomes fomentarius]
MVVPVALSLIFSLLLYYVWSTVAWRTRTHGRPLPPGPIPLPFIGNILDIPRFKAWEGFRDLCARYGDVLLLRIPTYPPLIILGNAKDAEEYLRKRREITADKLQSHLVELVGSGLNFAFYPYGERWEIHRRAFERHFSPKDVVEYRPVLLATSHKFLLRLLLDPLRFKDHIRFTFSASVLKIFYDIEAEDESDRYVSLIGLALEGPAQGLVPGKFWVEFLPFLKYVPAWVPGAGFQRKFARWRAAGQALKDTPFQGVKDARMRGESPECVIGHLLEDYDNDSEEGSHAVDEDVVKNVGAVAVEGGSDTTFSTLQTVLLAMSLYPAVLRKAQAELDTVVGRDRLPDFSDRPQLVYVNAIIKEALRWQNVIPLGVPHRLTQDDEFNGYFIPKGTLILPNIWAYMHDPEEYKDPDVFRPERFISENGNLDTSVRDPAKFVFGFGKRLCAGKHFAEASLFINVASMLHVFDITPPLDENGDPIAIRPAMSDGLLTYPEDARCTIKPRSTQAEHLIRTSV